MSRLPRHLARTAVLACCASILLAPGGARAAQSGGAVAPVPGSVVLAVKSQVMLGRTLRIAGTGVRPGAAVTVQRLDRRRGWVQVAGVRAAANGTFLARWRTNRIGRTSVRALVDGASSAGAITPASAVTVYKPARATWYGPGFFGKRTACGVRLTRSLLGVAHPTLPCGTQVDVWYGGRSLTVPVVDRGPFAHDASWDLTAAAAQALGFVRTDRIGAVAVRG